MKTTNTTVAAAAAAAADTAPSNRWTNLIGRKTTAETGKQYRP